MNHSALKSIAKSSKYQFLYNQSKEVNGIRLFRNDNDYSKVQIWFLHYLTTYNRLYRDLEMGEDYISEEVIDDELRAEAYLVLKDEEDTKKNKKSKNLNQKKENNTDIPTVIFN